MKEGADKTFTIVDAGMNDLLRPSHYGSYHRVEPAVRRSGAEKMVVDVVGPVCETGDTFAVARPLPALAVTALLVTGVAR